MYLDGDSWSLIGSTFIDSGTQPEPEQHRRAVTQRRPPENSIDLDSKGGAQCIGTKNVRQHK